jgi:uncharacterized membrane protein YraQ (UPF0718 family)
VEDRRTVADGLRLAVRALVYAVLGGAALIAIATVVSVLGPMLALDLYTPPVAAWWTVFTAIAVQGVPFLLLGTVVSAAIGAFVPEKVLSRLLPRNPALAVPVAGAAGVVLPGCECASVPVAGRLMRRGVAPAAALAFLLSAPAVNPVVLVATSIAFPGPRRGPRRRPPRSQSRCPGAELREGEAGRSTTAGTRSRAARSG